MKEYTDEQLAKLPKWAQGYIESLRRENRELNESIEQINGQMTDDTYSVLLKDGYGPEHTQVRQQINGLYGIDIKLPGKFEQKFNVRVDKDGQLHITATGYPSSLVVIPQASNVVNIVAVQKPYELGADK